MSERDDEADPQSPLAYTHSGSPLRRLRQMRQGWRALRASQENPEAAELKRDRP
jgi:hypothetical protein